MDKSRKTFLAAVTTAVLSLVGNGNAIAQPTTLENFQIDLTSILGNSTVGGVEQNKVVGIDEINFLANVQAVTDDDGNGLPDENEMFDTFAAGRVTDLTGNGSSVRTNAFGVETYIADGGGLTNGWELTFEFQVSGIFGTVNAEDANFEHKAGGEGGTTGELIIYVNPTGPGNLSSVDSGARIRQTEIGRFKIKAGDGGVIAFLVGDGSDDATFEFISGLPGVWLAEDGSDLTNPSIWQMFTAITDSNFDSDPDNTGTDFSHAPPLFDGINWGAKDCGNNAVDNCVQEDGSFVLAAEVVSSEVDVSKCYFGKQNPPFTADNPKLPVPIAQVSLSDQFADDRLTNAFFLQGLCNPAGKNMAVNPQRMDHLSCYSIAPAPGQPAFFPPSAVEIETQNFGLDTVRIGRELELCGQANKNGEFEPVGYFKCYSAGSAQRDFPGVTLDDQFDVAEDESRQIQRLSRFCTPAGKNAPDPAPIETDAPDTWKHLACYDLPRRNLRQSGAELDDKFIVKLTDQFIADAVGQAITFTTEFERHFCEPARKISVQ